MRAPPESVSEPLNNLSVSSVSVFLNLHFPFGPIHIFI